ncbi:peroxiredoxin family protein [Merismopedia glauca]|uniref:Alkyl hydroperoxide reductase n=1 Tax=Merismopedia glauca CCAP 1448/3 TaxID=1296344 RepID=A0A2T1BXD2_9CYAN|nr:redoxin domain-containing protein [Merismopedia glauca]PSB00669.1 alkyl hydroperoxide reductase [Merismopedia glauca CCAP 1448/3]
MISTNIDGLFNERFFQNFLPIPASNEIKIGAIAPDFLITDVKNQRQVRLLEYRDKQPVLLYFTRIFTEHQYCPLCYPHIIALNENYEEFQKLGVEVLTIASTDIKQSQRVIEDLGLKMPLLSDPSCFYGGLYHVGQALGAPLPAQFLVDREGKIQYRHLFSFLSPNAPVEILLNIAARYKSISKSELQLIAN